MTTLKRSAYKCSPAIPLTPLPNLFKLLLWLLNLFLKDVIVLPRKILAHSLHIFYILHEHIYKFDSETYCISSYLYLLNPSLHFKLCSNQNILKIFRPSICYHRLIAKNFLHVIRSMQGWPDRINNIPNPWQRWMKIHHQKIK